MKYIHVLTAVLNTPWAIREEKLSEIMRLLVLRSNGGEVSAEEISAVTQAHRSPRLVACENAPTLEEFNAARGVEWPTLSILPVEESVDGVLQFLAESTAVDRLVENKTYSREEIAEVFDVPAERVASSDTVTRSSAPSIAVLPLFGTISHRISMMNDMSGGTSTERFTKWFRAAVNDSAVKSIVIDVDSPGGTVNGVPELAEEIFNARSVKPIVAVSNAQMASAAYFLGSQASELIVTPSGEVGSIGVYAAHMDVSEAVAQDGRKVTLISAGKFKTEANPFEPLSDEARAAMQSRVDQYYKMFTDAVARGRDVTSQAVRDGYGQGRMLLADDAKKAGMVDRIATMDRTLKRLGAKTMTAMVPKSMTAESTSTREKQEEAVPAHVLAQKRRERELQLYVTP